ncbi:MAG TPA: acetoin utilization AcuC family protein [Candidatus Limnocylindrales bacterium]|nr:acetoin utilization AcuC family protein [Candidatus Limnocylindrales bacterium]
MVKRATDGPLLVYGPLSPTYDFGASHPLTPRRFGPGIDLLRAVGAEPRLVPEPARDDDLLLSHTAAYLAAVKRLSQEPSGPAEAGIGDGGDNPSFAGMHEAGAMVAGGSLRAVEAILRGDVDHAFHPGGGLHHAMPDHASGFCIYDDPALAIARARRDGLRVLYVDLDVHHGDGVEAIHESDPGVLTVSFHESGRYLFPGTGRASDVGEGAAAGTVVNVPFEPYAGEDAWLAAVRRLVPALAAAFAPDLVVSQHGADSHAWDPLAHLRVTTTAMAEAARLVDRVAHGSAGGRWLATGGGGYDAYRVVPRTWSLVWLAGAHRHAPVETPLAWRERWEAEAARYGQAPLPETFSDVANAGLPRDGAQAAAESASIAIADAVHATVVPALLRAAERNGWWDPRDVPASSHEERRAGRSAISPSIVALTSDLLERVSLAPRIAAVGDAAALRALLGRALASDTPTQARAVAALAGDVVVGLAVAEAGHEATPSEILALGVTPEHRRRGLGSALLAALVDAVPGPVQATVTLAERDPIEPLDRRLRASIARTMFERARFDVTAARSAASALDALAVAAVRPES